MDLNKLTTADKVVCGAAIVFLISTFLPWYGIDGFDGANTGWDYFLTGILPLLLAVVMVAQIAVSRFTTTPLPALPIPWGQVHLIAGAAIAVLLLLRTIIVSSVDTFAGDFELDRKWGLFVALLAALALAAGGFLKSKEPEAAQVGGPGGYPPPPGGPGGGYPPPPPGGGGGYPQQF
ncbi:MAG TPA: hypothetical protein VFS16_05410 [Acidimicrobiia bacterium]|nr:hypothetical protein [Acidimicrobiia bacterium]